MRSKKEVLFFSVTFFLISAFFTNSSAQIRRNGSSKHRSFYLSAGYNKSQFFNSTIHVEQSTLNNKYDLLKVKGDDLTTIKSLFPWQLNYRLGYYYNYEQTCGFEIGYDPVRYHITNGQNIQLKGTLSGVKNSNKTFPFLAANGYYYGMDGANFLLLNFVRRFTIFRPNSNKVGIDAIGKLGAGPAMPHFVSNLAKDSFSAPQFGLYGWNGAAEAALRITVYRYAYLEIAGKYDYAMYNNLKIYKGTATQNLQTIEIIGSIGFTFPSNKFNPLFHHERKIITIIPFFMDKKIADSTERQELEEKKNKSKGDDEQMQDIPEFQNVKDKRNKWEDQINKIREDSLAQLAALDSIAHQAVMDSIANKEMNDSIARKIYNDSVDAAQGPRDTLSISAMDTTAKPALPAHDETRKERKARLKKEKEALKENANGGEATPAPPAGIEAAPPVPGATENAEVPDKKALKAKRKQEEREQREKERMEQEAKDKAEKERIEQEMNAKNEQDQKDQAKEEQEKKDKKEKKEQEKKEREEKKAQEKKEREEQKEKERKDREDQKEKERKEKEEKKDTEGK